MRKILITAAKTVTGLFLSTAITEQRIVSII